MASFKDVPTGTKCFVETRNGWYITYVVRHTRTQVVTKSTKDTSETKWDIDSGKQIGTDRWTFNVLEVFEDKHQSIVDAALLKRQLNTVLSELSSNVLKLSKEDLLILQGMLHSTK